MDQPRTLIGIITFGNVEFTRLTIESIRETATSAVDFCVVVGKPRDVQTRRWLVRDSGVSAWIEHSENKGFPAGINDIYDFAFKREIPGAYQYDNLILAGNDIVPYPGAINALIEQANTTDFEWVAASMFDVQSLVRIYPDQGKYFDGPNYDFKHWSASADSGATRGEPTVRPWEVHNPVVAAAPRIADFNREGPSLIKDVRNLCLFKRSVFDKIGYADVNFWPGGYFEDNDYARRAVNAGIQSCALNHAQYFHFWSRTIHQGSASGEMMSPGKREHHFALNQAYYIQKWGGPFGSEKFTIPFDGKPFFLDGPLGLPASLKIPDRTEEPHIIEYWSTR